MSLIFEEKPRWKNGPPQCLAANLPALPTLAKLREFNTPRGSFVAKMTEWQCAVCEHWHSKAEKPKGRRTRRE
jgi:hypothetical protein